MSPNDSGNRDGYSDGNGSLMRCIPYAFVQDFSKGIFQMVMENRMTHPSALCNTCCIFYARMVRSLAEGNDKLTAYKSAISFIRYGLRITDGGDDDEEFAKHFDFLFSFSFANASENDIISSGYVIRTLEAAVWCFLNTENYQDAVLKAINLGGDTDTIAALTGALAGISYGKGEIPSKWKNSIVNKEGIRDILQLVIATFSN